MLEMTVEGTMVVMVAKLEMTMLEVTMEETMAVMVVDDGGANGRGGGCTEVMLAALLG